MAAHTWIGRANTTGTGGAEPPRSGKGATKAAWRKHAESLGYPIPADAGRDDIIALVDTGPPPTVRSEPGDDEDGPVLAATDQALASATHLTDADAGAVAVLRDLARTIDADARRRGHHSDNWTKPTYLNYAESLGLTPLARMKLPADKRPTGRLAELRAIRGGQAS